MPPTRQPQPAVRAPTADHRRGARIRVVAGEARPGHAEQLRDLLGHLLEDAPRRRRGRRRAWRRGARRPARLRARAWSLRLRALGRHGRQQERGERRGGDEQLGREQAVGDRLAHERPVVLRRLVDRDRADDEDRRRRAARAEADRRPQQHREHDEGHVALRRERGQRHQQREHERALEQLRPPEPVQARPREDHRRDDQHAGRVAERPRPHDPPELVGLDHVAEAQRERPERRADHRGDQRARDERQHVRTRSSDPRPRVNRRSSHAATTSATVLPTVCASTVPSGVE